MASLMPELAQCSDCNRVRGAHKGLGNEAKGVTTDVLSERNAAEHIFETVYVRP